jgi:hypothetical protein
MREVVEASRAMLAVLREHGWQPQDEAYRLSAEGVLFVHERGEYERFAAAVDACTDVEAVGPVFAPDPVDPASMAGWRCGRCGSSRWVGWRAGPEHEGWPLQAQCVPCGRVQAMTERGRWWRHG